MISKISFFLGLLGNLMSLVVFLSPIPTFYNIYKTKSTGEHHVIPYLVGLFSSVLTLYYGSLEEESGALLISINSVGIATMTFYVTVFMIYAPKQAKAFWVLMIFNVGLVGLVILLASLLTHGYTRQNLIGWVCAFCSVCFFASPLCAIKRVIRPRRSNPP